MPRVPNEHTGYQRDNDDMDFLSRIQTPMDKEEETVRTGSPETEDSEHLLRQDEQIREKQPRKRQGEIGSSLLSPVNELNKKQEDTDGYVSPFSEQYEEKVQEEEEVPEEERLISKNRLQFFGMCALILYVVALCIGYHYTNFVNDEPQVVTLAQRDEAEYFEQANDYILVLQELHAESIESTENYTQSIIGSDELVERTKQNNKKLTEMQEQIKDLKPPAKYEHFNSLLLEMYSLQAAFNTTLNTYSKAKTEEAFQIVNEANNKYEDKSAEFLTLYNEALEK